MKFLFTIFSLMLLNLHVWGSDVAANGLDLDPREAGKMLRQLVAGKLGIDEGTLVAAIMKVKKNRLATPPASGNAFEGVIPELAVALNIQEETLKNVLNSLTEEERSDF